MGKKNIFFIFIFIFVSCTSLKKQSYKGIVINKEKEQIKVNHKFKLPKGENVIIKTSGMEKEKCFKYSDSSIFYIANCVAWELPNDEIIKDTKLSNCFKCYSYTYEGKENELYWKEVKIGEMKIGYKKANSNKKYIFDKAIEQIIR